MHGIEFKRISLYYQLVQNKTKIDKIRRLQFAPFWKKYAFLLLFTRLLFAQLCDFQLILQERDYICFRSNVIMTTLVFLLPNYPFESSYVDLAWLFLFLPFICLFFFFEFEQKVYLITVIICFSLKNVQEKTSGCTWPHWIAFKNIKETWQRTFNASSFIQSLLIFLIVAQQQSVQVSPF